MWLIADERRQPELAADCRATVSNIFAASSQRCSRSAARPATNDALCSREVVAGGDRQIVGLLVAPGGERHERSHGRSRCDLPCPASRRFRTCCSARSTYACARRGVAQHRAERDHLVGGAVADHRRGARRDPAAARAVVRPADGGLRDRQRRRRLPPRPAGDWLPASRRKSSSVRRVGLLHLALVGGRLRAERNERRCLVAAASHGADLRVDERPIAGQSAR